MSSEFYETEPPALSGEDAIAILNTPDEELGCADRSREEFTISNIKEIV